MTASLTQWHATAVAPSQGRWLFGLIARRFYARSCAVTKTLFTQVRNSDRFLRRYRSATDVILARVSLFGIVPFPERLSQSFQSSASGDCATELDQLLETAGFCRLRGFPPVGGYASWRDESRHSIIIGLEGWVAIMPLFAASAASHELMHCGQQVNANAFTLEWTSDGLTVGEWIYLELHAHLYGSRLWLASLSFLPCVFAILVASELFF